jgi:hypothetical protein
MSGCNSRGCVQLRAMCRKNATVARRSWRPLLSAAVLVPLGIVALLGGFQALSDAVLTASTPHPATVTVGPLPRCALPPPRRGGESGGGCISLLFSPNTPGARALMSALAVDAGLALDVDVAPLPGGAPVDGAWCNASAAAGALVPCAELGAPGCLPCAYIADNATLTDALLTDAPYTQAALLILSEYIPGPTRAALGLPNATSWALFYNTSLGAFPLFADDHAMALKAALDAAEMRVALGVDAAPALTLGWRKFPAPSSRIAGWVPALRPLHWCW